MATQDRARCSEKLKARWGYVRPEGESGDYLTAWIATLVEGLADWAGDDISEPSRLRERLIAGERPALEVESIQGASSRLVVREIRPSSADAITAMAKALGLIEGVPADDVWVATLVLLENVEKGLEPGLGNYLDALVGQADSDQTPDEGGATGSTSPTQTISGGGPGTTRSALKCMPAERRDDERSSGTTAPCPKESGNDQVSAGSGDELHALRADVARSAATVDKQLKAFALDLRKLKAQWTATAEELTSGLSSLADGAHSWTRSTEAFGRKLTALQRSSDDLITEQRSNAAAVQQASEKNFEDWATHSAEIEQRLERLECVLASRLDVEHLERYEAVRKTIESMVVDRVRRELAHALKTLLLQLQHAAKNGDVDGVQALAVELEKRMVALGLR